VALDLPVGVGPGNSMSWRVLIELTEPDGRVRLEEVMAGGGRALDPLAGSPIGLTLAEGKTILAGL
jgi:hypothetical protein